MVNVARCVAGAVVTCFTAYPVLFCPVDLGLALTLVLVLVLTLTLTLTLAPSMYVSTVG
ncbi:hypothetical protein GGR50DRAFT_668415 [Xylaria sp. CBS 124048]|nr:hypothetical protein GGR50DRAFT_668415 [Xylaria sp. CBS 124048]